MKEYRIIRTTEYSLDSWIRGDFTFEFDSFKLGEWGLSDVCKVCDHEQVYYLYVTLYKEK